MCPLHKSARMRERVWEMSVRREVVIDRRWEGIEQAAWTVLLGAGQ